MSVLTISDHEADDRTRDFDGLPVRADEGETKNGYVA
jgi:hypothetical protein